MEFFPNSYAHDEALLWRKRSFNRDRPSTGDKPSHEFSKLKRSASLSTPSVSGIVRSSGTRPPPSTPVSAGTSRPRGSAPTENPPANPVPCEQTSTSAQFTRPIERSSSLRNQSSSYEWSSTPIPSTKPIKRNSPRSVSNLIIDVASSKHPSLSTSGAQTAPCQTKPRLSGEANVNSSVVPPSTLQGHVVGTIPSIFTYYNPTLRRSASVSVSTFQRITRVESGSLSKSANSLGTMSPAYIPPRSPKPLTTLPTPISPHESRSTTRMESGMKPFGYARSRSQPRTQPRPASEGYRSRHAPASQLQLNGSPLPPSYTPTTGIGTTTPIHDPEDNREDNHSSSILRKPSLTKSEPMSSSDIERKRRTHRPRTRSGVFAAFRRNNNASPFNLIPPPTPTTGLTPAGTFFVDYAGSRQDTSFNIPRDTAFGNSGKVVAVGSPEDEPKSPWTTGLGWRNVRSLPHEDEKKMSLRRNFGRVFSDRWGGKDSEHVQQGGARQSIFGGDLTQQKLKRSPKRPASRKEDKVHGFSSEVSFRADHQNGLGEGGEGRVWEERVGEWAFDQTHEVQELESPNSSRLWKLVKRLSNGSLKEKHAPPRGTPPPVPPLPKTFGLEGWTDLGNSEIPRDLGPNTPITTSASRLSPCTSHHTDTKRNTLKRTKSDNTKVFSRSRKSSTSSSYGETTIPPIPNAQVDRHIVPPHELYRLVNAKDDEGCPTVCPPASFVRNSTTPENPASSSSSTNVSPTSVTIPKFEVRYPFNGFAPHCHIQSRKCSVSPTPHLFDNDPPSPCEEQTLLPPPRSISSRNTHRPSTGTSLALTVRQEPPPGVILKQTPDEPEAADMLPPRPRSSHTRPRRTPSARPRSVSDGAAITESVKKQKAPRSPMKFRELTTPKRPLTEQEKIAKWEDLLQRSDMAGGTLHLASNAIGDVALWSDSASLAPSETLDRF